MQRKDVRNFLEEEVERLTEDDCDPIRLVCVTSLLERIDTNEEWTGLGHFFNTASKDFLEEAEGEMEKLDDELKAVEDEVAKADPDITVLTKAEATAMLRSQTVPSDRLLMVRGYGADGGDPIELDMWSEVGQSDLDSYEDGSDPFEGYEDRDFELWRQ